jgi:Mce-associated membrane protein
MAADADAANRKLTESPTTTSPNDTNSGSSPQYAAPEETSTAAGQSATQASRIDAETDSRPAELDADTDIAAEADEVTEDESAPAAPASRPVSGVGVALVFGLVAVLALAGLIGWLGYRTHESRHAKAQRELFVEVGRQAAINLTTIYFQEVDTDVPRILDSSTGAFYDNFQKRSQPFIETVKQAESKTAGTVAGASLESESGNEARVLVAVTVKTSDAGHAEQQPRGWRMRIDVQKVGDGAKASNVEFVS